MRIIITYLLLAQVITACAGPDEEKIARYLHVNPSQVTIETTDTLYIPVRVVMALSYTAVTDHSALIQKFTAASENPAKSLYTRLISEGDSIYHEHMKFYDEIEREIRYPRKATADDITGSCRIFVYVKFLVNTPNGRRHVYKQLETDEISSIAENPEKELSACRDYLEQLRQYIQRRRAAMRTLWP